MTRKRHFCSPRNHVQVRSRGHRAGNSPGDCGIGPRAVSVTVQYGRAHELPQAGMQHGSLTDALAARTKTAHIGCIDHAPPTSNTRHSTIASHVSHSEAATFARCLARTHTLIERFRCSFFNSFLAQVMLWRRCLGGPPRRTVVAAVWDAGTGLSPRSCGCCSAAIARLGNARQSCIGCLCLG
jgi:hypothetical protein